MISRFLPNTKGDSIVNYYLLPLTGNSKKDFGDNFVVAKVNTQGTVVFVEVLSDIYSDKVYPNKIVLDNRLFVFFNIEKRFIKDAKLIIDGKYRLISDIAKNTIIETSGLLYVKRKNGTVFTSKLILALYSHEGLYNYIYDILKSTNARHNAKLTETLNDVSLMEKLEDADFIF